MRTIATCPLAQRARVCVCVCVCVRACTRARVCARVCVCARLRVCARGACVYFFFQRCLVAYYICCVVA